MEKSLVETNFFTLHKLADGVYAAIIKPGEGAWSNSGFVDMGEELLVFDCFSTAAAANELRKLAEEITGKKVTYVFNSHFHGDHVFGNQVFEDTTIISTSLTRKLIQDNNVMADPALEQQKMSAYLDSLKEQIESITNEVLKTSNINQYKEMSKIRDSVLELRTVLPSVTFENKLVLHGSKRNVEFYCFGGGHTPSDAFMYLPEEKIAFLGDIHAENNHFPIDNPEEFITILEKIKKMDIEVAIPGHGNIGDLSLSDTIIEYLTFLIKKAKDAHQRNLTLDDFILENTEHPYTLWQGHNGIKANLTSVYNFYKA